MIFDKCVLLICERFRTPSRVPDGSLLCDSNFKWHGIYVQEHMWCRHTKQWYRSQIEYMFPNIIRYMMWWRMEYCGRDRWMDGTNVNSIGPTSNAIKTYKQMLVGYTMRAVSMSYTCVAPYNCFDLFRICGCSVVYGCARIWTQVAWRRAVTAPIVFHIISETYILVNKCVDHVRYDDDCLYYISVPVKSRDSLAAPQPRRLTHSREKETSCKYTMVAPRSVRVRT